MRFAASPNPARYEPLMRRFHVRSVVSWTKQAEAAETVQNFLLETAKLAQAAQTEAAMVAVTMKEAAAMETPGLEVITNCPSRCANGDTTSLRQRWQSIQI